jgi:outer membrane receptor protein involved in Fe transport
MILPVASMADAAVQGAAVDEIVVTTRKREENLQEVPIAIGVFSADDIQRIGIRDLDDVTKLSPSLQFDRNYSNNSVRVTVRGLSNTRGRSNVAFLVDGIDVTSETTGTNAGSPLLVNQRLLADVERIEVVRGPQSALYGRSAFAGAINYVSKGASDEFSGNFTADATVYDKQEFFAGISGPLTDTLGYRLSGVYWDDEGYYKNVVSGKEFGGGDGYGLAGTLVWEPADQFSIKGRVTWSDDNYAPGAVAPIFGGRVTLQLPDTATMVDPDLCAADTAFCSPVTRTTEVNPLPRVGDADGLEVRASEDPLTGGDYPGNTLEVFRASLIADWDIGDFTLSSYSGFTDADATQRYDLDRRAEGRPDTLLGHNDIDTFGNTEQLSQELRLATNWANSPVQATVGLQYWHEERDDFARSIGVVCRFSSYCEPGIDPYSSWQELYERVGINSPDFRSETLAETDHRSAYAMLEWDLTDTIKLTAETRLVKEDFEAVAPSWSSCLNLYPFNTSLEFDVLDPNIPDPNCDQGEIQKSKTSSDYQTPKVTLEWQASDSALVYALAAKGVKPAGIGLIRVPIKILAQDIETFEFLPEKMWSYEIGAKTEWQGGFGQLVVNGAVFYQDYSDKQTNTQQEVTTCTTDPPPDPGTPCAPEDERSALIGVVTNASAAWVRGLEIETSWSTPIEGLTLGLGYTWLDSEYDDFTDETRSSGRIAIEGECNEKVLIGKRTEFVDPETDQTIVRDSRRPHCALDLSGNTLEQMPRNSLVLTGRYEALWNYPGWIWFIEGNASYQDERYTSADNFTKLDDFWIADARFGVTDDNWEIILYLDNVFDDNTITSSGGNPDLNSIVDVPGVTAAPDFLATAFLPAPRTLGARLRYRF